MANNANPAPRLTREKQTISAMIRLYCLAHHGSREGLCPECARLREYAFCRLDRCPFGEEKPTCAKCLIHCYKPEMRARVKDVMRYAGPRMVVRHPVLAILHQLDSLRGRPPRSSRKS